MKFAKLLSVVLFAMMLISSVSFGQAIPSGTARYEALGNSPFILDASIDMNNNPAWTTQYKNYAFGDLGRNTVNDFELSDQWAGANFGVSKKINLGIVANKTESMWSAFSNWNSNYVVDSLGISAPIVPLKVLFGWQTSPNFALGVAPQFASWSSENDQTVSGVNSNLKKSSMTFGGTVGVIGKLNKSDWIEGAVDFKSNTFSWESTSPSGNQTIDNSGGMELGIFTRAFFVVEKSLSLKLVPFLSFDMYGFDPQNSASTAAFNQYSWMNFMGGLGINMPVLDDGFIAGGLSFGYSSYEDKLDGSGTFSANEFMLPEINMGIEWNFTEWLQGRVGYQRAVSNGSYKWEATSGDVYENKNSFASNPVQTISTGLGFQFGRFSLDGTIGEKFYKQSPYIVSGKTQDVFGVLSASYNFAK
ncbi:MAG: hypothetical protein L0Y76_01920 [Ignavibacteria bacterium]|nr:hypothetical protein [Ignavibacteria bacterium]